MSSDRPNPTQTLRNWNNHLVARCAVFRPERAEDARRIVTDGHRQTMIPRGLGRSYSDANLNDGGAVILGGRLDRILGFDHETGVVECEGGVSLEEIIECCLPKGFFPPVTPGTKYVTMGGAIANDVHGKNHHRDGSIGSHVVDLVLLTPSGRVIHCSPDDNADVFRATVGGLGLTGVILQARLRLHRVGSAYLKVDYARARHLDDALERFTAADAQYQHSIAWVDAMARGRSLGRGVVMQADHAASEDLPEPLRADPYRVRLARRLVVPFYLPGWALNGVAVRTFNRLYTFAHPDRTGVIVPFDRFFYPLDAVGRWYRLVGRRGFVQYQAVFPPEVSRNAVAELLERIARSGRASFLAVLKAMGPGNGGLLSFPMAGHTLAIDLRNTGAGLAAFMRELNELALEYGGRVYLAKDAFLDAGSMARMYPELARFKAIQSELDPERRFSSTLARRLGLVEIGP